MMMAVARTVTAAFALGAVLAGDIPSLSAQDLITRTELRRGAITGSKTREVIMTLMELKSGAKQPRHTHPGDEFLYVIAGGTVETAAGKTVTFMPGQTIEFPRGLAHGGFTVTSPTPLKALTVHIVKKGKPLVQLVK